MKKTLLLGGIGAGFITIMAFAARHQSTAPATQWEYATIVDAVVYADKPVIEDKKARRQYEAHAYVCFATINGCNNEEVKQSSNRLEPLNAEPDTHSAVRNVYAKALAQLGAQGWELVGNGIFDDPSQPDNHLVLKRAIKQK